MTTSITLSDADSKNINKYNDNIVQATRSNINESSIVLIQEQAEVQSAFPMVDMKSKSCYDDVHITPSFIEFKEATEGITSSQSIVIQNRGTKPAFIRIREPNSMAFQVKTLKAGVMLSPGLSVSTSVIYSFRRPALLRAIIPIEINNKIFDYWVICTLATERINIQPTFLDFGTIDVGYMSETKFITIFNEGGKSTRFSIDLGKNDLDISVRPLRGIVRPYKTTDLKVEIIGAKEGVFFSEFWIKSTPNIRVALKVNIITHRLIIYHPNSTGEFALIDFPPTVKNTCKYNTFVLRNISSRACNYIVLGEVNNEFKSIRNIDCRKYPVYGAFEINPIEGHIGPFEGIIFTIGFRPTMKLLKSREILYKQDAKYKKMKNKEDDFMAFIRIIKFHCAEVLNIPGIDCRMETSFDEAMPAKIHMQETLMDFSSSSKSSSSMVQLDDHNTVKLCLYGEMEVVKLNLQPDILYFGDLYIGETSQRVVCISNLSSIESVTFQCVPAAAVQCYPKYAKLKPKGSIEVLVKIQARGNVGPSFVLLIDAIVDSEDPALTKRPVKVKIGTFRVKCMVNVFYKNRKPSPCKNGSVTDCVTFGSDKSIPRQAMLLYKQNSKKSWENNGFEDDDVEIISRLMRVPKQYKELPRILPCNKLFVKKPSISEINAEVLIPLTPTQIYNVHVHPATVDFGMVALKTSNYRQLIAENRNEFSIKIQFLSSLQNIRFPDGDTMILHPEKTMIKLVELCGSSMGKFNGFINYNINGNHSFELSVIAEIVHKDLSIDKREIIIGKDYLEDESYRPQWAIVQIRNKLDASTRFKWSVPATSCFCMEPKYGIVRGDSILNTFVSYDADPLKVPFAEMIMKCESGTYSTLRCNLSSAVPKVAFVNDHTDLGELSLNLPSRVNAILQNSEFTEVVYEIDPTSLIHGCEINPLRGRIPPRGIVVLEASFKFDACIDFTVAIIVMVQKHMRLQWKVKGRVLFPRLKFTPQSIEQRRVIVNTFQRHLITVTNVGTTTTKLQFVLQEYPEFSVLIVPNKKANTIVEDETSVIIPAGLSQRFYLHFKPLDPASYAFYLPIVINDLLGPVLETDPATLKPREYLASQEQFYKDTTGITFLELPSKLPFISIDFTVAGHVVLFNKFEFNFNVATNDVLDELRIQNLDKPDGVTLIIKTDGFMEDDCPFFIRWSHGIQPTITSTSIVSALLRDEETVFVLEFEPKCRGAFKLEVPIFIQTETEDIPFNSIYFYGANPEKLIETNVSEIYLLPVPLNIPIEESFKLKARYFECTSNILWDILPPDRCSGDFKKEMLHISFPNNNIISAASYVELDVKITFKSETTISFCSKIEFHDEQGLALCPVRVYATADNNLLSTHAYLRQSFDHFQQYFSSYEKDATVSVVEEQCSIAESEIEEYNYTNNQTTNNYVARSQPKISRNLENEEIYNDIDENENVQEKNSSKAKSQSLKDSSAFFMEVSVENHELSTNIMYPCFPMDDETMNDYGQYMHRTLLCAEQWLYINIFHYSFYPNVLDGITASFSIVNQMNVTRRNNVKGKSRSLGKSFVDALELLLGSRIYNHLEKWSSLPPDDVQRIDLILRQYERMLDFLLQQGACLAHVPAYFLLNYNDYIVFIEPTQFTSWKKKLESYHFIKLSKPLFESRSKQCWLDVILQTYKCCKFNYINVDELRKKLIRYSTASSRRSTSHRESTLSATSFRRMTDLLDKSIECVIELMQTRMKESDRSTGEILLLSWLQYHYEEQRTKDWLIDKKITLKAQDGDNLPHQKQIDNFNLALSDSLVLIAVTGAYCPFLIVECFSNLYIHPRSIEEVLHNATCLVTGWTKIRLGFMITPSQIIHPNSVQMLMLVTHLFEILPSYVPKFKIRFSCPLSQTIVKQVTFSNPTDGVVEYLLLFIDNDNGFFSLMQAQSRIRINAHDNVQLKICFHAKKIKKTKAYLLLCGAAYGPHFGNNQTYILEGNVNSLEVSKEYDVCSKLYQILDTTLSIKIPYKNEAEYEIWMAEEQPSNLVNLKMTKWSELRTRTVPRRLFLNQKVITVDEGVTEANLAITIACIIPSPKKFWLVFQSKTGDFIIQIISRCQPSLTDRIIVQWNKEHGECTCTDVQGSNADCPYNVNIFIPSRNGKLWNCVNHMFQKTLDVKERLFWSRYLDTYIGLRLIHWLMGYNADSAASEFMHIFNATVTYSVSTTEKNGSLSVPSTFVINDVRLENEHVPMRVHLCPTISDIYEMTLSLTSEDGKELRLYAVSFLHIERSSHEDHRMLLDVYENKETGEWTKVGSQEK
ncbi:hypothetical protein KPH14_006516 [Odynerus spinipes]|uniref:Cilia- and flagella-associated protein 47 domain-containing protein n=1 Tax=Odynerus spinipes TaxID=1348599 RepID=A0AAD9RQP5_9HYME|nr:hypothetical protein KPH14_006516 [Odynerus spinipes]